MIAINKWNSGIAGKHIEIKEKTMAAVSTRGYNARAGHLPPL
jgi:hypothetical protein